MNPLEDPVPPGPDGGARSRSDRVGAFAPLDELDAKIMTGVRDLYETIDPMPADLVERVRFALALEDLDVDVFRRFPEPELAVVARGHEESRTVTFDSESLTIMVSITATGEQVVRLDGWLAPPASHRVELRTERGPLLTTADAQGRFALDEVPHGLAQLVVHPVDGQPSTLGRSVVTPSIVV
jgi:hypothetical protein